MQLLQPVQPILTALPAAPVDGQVIMFQPAAGLVQHLRYNAATSSWVTVGGKSAYSYSAYRNGAHNGGNAGIGYVNLFCDTVVYDPGGCQSPTQLGYVCKVAGRYLVAGQCRYTTSSGFSAVSVFKNAAMFREGALTAAGASGFITAIVNAVVNDVLAIYVYHGAAGSALNAFSAGDNWMQVELLDYA